MIKDKSAKYNKIRNKANLQTYNDKVDEQYDNICGKIDNSLKYLDN